MSRPLSEQTLSAPGYGTASPPMADLTRAKSVPPEFYRLLNDRLTAGHQRFTDTLLHRLIDAEARSYICATNRTPSPATLERGWSGAMDWDSIIEVAPNTTAETFDTSIIAATTITTAETFDTPISAATTNITAETFDSPINAATTDTTKETFDTSVIAATTSNKVIDVIGFKCMVCLEEYKGENPVKGLCGNADCVEVFCSNCITMHCLTAVGDSRFMVLPVRCPAPFCGRRVPTQRWENYVPVDDFDSYEDAAKAILTLRCPSCHTPRTLFQESLSPAERKAKLNSTIPAEAIVPNSVLQKTWARFRDGAASAEEILNVLLDVFGVNIEDFIEDRGDDTSLLCDILSLVTDVERRTVLHLAALRRFPFIHTSCCMAEMCWKCKVAGHHDGRTCEEVQRADLESNASVDIQFCPGCNVATERTEGCDHMICLCGYEWTWEGGDDDDY